MIKNVELNFFATPDALAQAVAAAWLSEIKKSHRAQQTHCVALSGGRITKTFFSQVVKLGQGRPELFSNVHFFWADERCVPPGDPDSNFALADELLFQPLKIAPDKIHRLRGEMEPETAARVATAEILAVAPGASGQPVLDIIFLGLGEDGHVASLFPNAPDEVLNTVAPVLAIDHSPKPPPRRLTLSYPAIAAARQVWVLASGAGKENALTNSLSDDGITPLAHMLRSRSATRLFTDINI